MNTRIAWILLLGSLAAVTGGPARADDIEAYMNTACPPEGASMAGMAAHSSGALYAAMFLPQADHGNGLSTPGAPAVWPGNLKKLHLSPSDPPTVVDAGSPPQAAIGDDGRIYANALTHWTVANQGALDTGDVNGDGRVEPPTLNPYAPGNPPGVVTHRDGPHVIRGGAGQKIPGFGTGQPGPGDRNIAGARQLFYLDDDGRLAPLEASDAVAGQLGGRLLGAAAHPPEVMQLLRYIRGQDVNDEDGNDNRTEARHWLMGDVLHSRPLAIDYGQEVFIAVASNDGFLRLIRDADGQEAWGFMPEEAMPVQARLLAGRGARNGEDLHPYAFDGEPAALVIDNDRDGVIAASRGDAVYLFIGLRRAGRAYYAFDITDPFHPLFLWKVSHAGRRSAAAVALTDTDDYRELGLAFSAPRTGAVLRGQTADGSVAARRPAVFFGGGYNGGPPTVAQDADGGRRLVRPGKDSRASASDDGTGNALFILDALTGELVWKAVGGTTTGPTSDARVFRHEQLRDGIASDLTVLDTNADGVHDRILVGDTGGNLWRADLGFDADPPAGGTRAFKDDWKLVRLACLGRHGGSGCTPVPGKIHDRRFFHAPDFVHMLHGGDSVGAIVIGSGDRANPLDRQADDADIDLDEPRDGPVAQNRMFLVRDPNPRMGEARDLDYDSDVLTNVSSGCPGTGCAIGPAGWFFDLPEPGEKVLSSPLTMDQTVYFTSYRPPPGDAATGCGERQDSGALYSVRLQDGTAAGSLLGTPGDESTTSAGRTRPLPGRGIPPPLVLLGTGVTARSAAEAGAGPACRMHLLAGLEIVRSSGCPRYRTFWQRLD